MATSKWKLAFVWILLLLIGVSFVPFELTIAPERKLRITDSKGNPIANARVRQIWYQYALNIKGEVDFKSDLSGEVILPRRAIRTNIFSLMSGTIKEISELGSNAGLRSTESIGILAEGFRERWFHSATVEGIKELEDGVAILEKE